MRFHLAFLLTIAVLQPLHAEPGSTYKIGVPALSWVFDAEAMAIRPVSGTLGAAILGDPLDFGFPLAAAEIASRGRFAIVISAENRGPQVIAFDTGSVLAIEGALPSPDRIVLSPAGSAALLFSSKDRRLQTITGLPQTPKVIRDITLSQAAGPATAFAVNDDAERTLLVLADDAVWVADSNGQLYPIALQASAVSYRPGSSDAVAASRSGEIYRIGSDGAITQIGMVVGEDIGDPVGIRLSADGSVAYAVYSKGTVAEVESASGNVRSVSCGCAATGLHSVNDPSTFRVNDATAAPLWLVNMSNTGPRLWFIPSNRGER